MGFSLYNNFLVVGLARLLLSRLQYFYFITGGRNGASLCFLFKGQIYGQCQNGWGVGGGLWEVEVGGGGGGGRGGGVEVFRDGWGF